MLNLRAIEAGSDVTNFSNRSRIGEGAAKMANTNIACEWWTREARTTKREGRGKPALPKVSPGVSLKQVISDSPPAPAFLCAPVLPRRKLEQKKKTLKKKCAVSYHPAHSILI